MIEFFTFRLLRTMKNVIATLLCSATALVAIASSGAEQPDRPDRQYPLLDLNERFRTEISAIRFVLFLVVLAALFFAMRQILSNHAASRRRLKRGGGHEHEPVHSGIAIDLPTTGAVDLIDLDAALTDFSEKFPRQARVVELRYFAALSIEDAAKALDISPRTAKTDWQMARAWLSMALSGREEA